MNTTLIITTLALYAGTTSAGCPACRGGEPSAHVEPNTIGQQSQEPPRVEVVFVLDTTGSMGGLIESAKDKIWSIATAIAQAQPAPEIRMGLIGYRDRGEEYVTTRTPMTGDLDAVYSELTAYQARGGGDQPESVNQALFEAVERFEWTEGDSVLRMIYLVGDAPPQMDYQDDIKHPASCRLAREKRILINTIQCGSIGGTREVWQTIAQGANGRYAAIAQDGGTRAIATPYDEEVRRLDQELLSLMIDYGDAETLAIQHARRERAAGLSATAAPEAAADRAIYNQSRAGRTNLYGRQELVYDFVNSVVRLEDIPADQLPESFRSMTRTELEAEIERNQSRRDAIAARL
ncbi:MAG: vWA domain-containing protein, partial [Planctomycetota bacterium]